MPNIIIEVSDKTIVSQPERLLARINTALWQSGSFKQPSDIKSRLYFPRHVVIGEGETLDKFIMVHFYLMPGRDDDTIGALSRRIAEAITLYLQECERHVGEGKLQICVNPITLSNNYVKQIF